MTTDRADEPPQGRADPERATFLELFFDLVYVFALLQVGHRLIEGVGSEHVLVESGQTLLLLLAVWLVWTYEAWATSTFDPRRLVVQAKVVATMFGSLVMAVAAPRAFDDRAMLFAGAYVATQLARPVILALGFPDKGKKRLAVRILFWFGITAVPWITGALLPEGPRAVLWAVAIAIDYTVAPLGWPTPWLGRTGSAEWTISGDHVGERYRLLFLIALGDLILETGIAFSETDWNADHSAAFLGHSAAFLVSFLTTVLLWRIYFFRAGELITAAIAAAPYPSRLARSAAYTHLLILAGTVATAVGYRLVIAHPFGPTDSAWIGVILGGPALFLLGRGGFEHAVFARVSVSRLIGALVLAILSPAMIRLPPLMVAITASLVLLGIAVTDAVRARRQPQEQPSPPR